jgi:hypothetical protein
MKKFVVLLTLTLSMQAFAQVNQNENIVEDTKRDLYIITGAGLGGAILGLSTLSFVSEPEDHTKNIVVGGSLGIIGGVIVVAMLQAERTKSYSDPDYIQGAAPTADFETQDRAVWHAESYQQNQFNMQQGFQFSRAF